MPGLFTEVERRNWEAREVGAGRRARRGPFVSAAEQTRLSWARRIATLDDVPAAYRETVLGIAPEADPPYTVLCPAFPHHRHRTEERLILDLGDRLGVLARSPAGVSVTMHPLAALHAVEVGDVLLDGWLTLRGRQADGSPATSTLRFNTVTLGLMLPFVARSRRVANPPADVDADAAPARLAWLRPIDFKFHGLARRALRAGDRLVDVVFQPRIVARVRGLPGRLFRRTVAHRQVVLLTDTELILVTDTLHAPDADLGHRYGGVCTYVPADRIVGATIATREDGLLTARFALPADDELEVVAEPGARGDVERLIANLAALAPQVAVG